MYARTIYIAHNVWYIIYLSFRFLTINRNILTNQIHSVKSLPKWFLRVQLFGKAEKRSSFPDFLTISKRFYNISVTHINKRCDSQDHNVVFPQENKCFLVIFKDRTWRSIFTPKKYCSSVLQKSHNVINDLIQVIVLKFVAEFLGSPVLGDRNTGILVLCTILV